MWRSSTITMRHFSCTGILWWGNLPKLSWISTNIMECCGSQWLWSWRLIKLIWKTIFKFGTRAISNPNSSLDFDRKSPNYCKNFSSLFIFSTHFLAGTRKNLCLHHGNLRHFYDNFASFYRNLDSRYCRSRSSGMDGISGTNLGWHG